MFKIGLIGYGYWGPNLARNFNVNPDIQLSAICDFSESRLELACRFFPQAETGKDTEKIFKNKDIDAVAIATPVSTHYDLAKQALLADKHVWLEKPMTETVQQAEELIELAQKKNKVLFVDHTFVYTGAVRKIKELVDKNELGDIVYFDSTRVNLGLFQQDINVIWDLAPHDISIMDYLIPLKKLSVSATGLKYKGNGINPKSMLTIDMENYVVAHINVSWLSPVKIRQTLIGGSRKMILYDDNHPDEKVKVYDKGVHIYETKEDLYRLNVQYRVGDMYVPKLNNQEALAVEAQHFADCVIKGEKPLTGGQAGLEVVKILTAANQSLKQRGAPVEITN
ncbi:MAG: gfo/Idh/MocA family oxidoreductase [Desulfobacteraceae bacterium]|nr:MAG: gfo/Idh/MocA family oxidoreductase [Desulfobacteraceae bacterium]